MRDLRRIVVHHSGARRSQTAEEIRRYHVEDLGWSDIFYHFVVEQWGRIFPGRSLDRPGGDRGDAIEVCVVGDNTTPGQEWTPAQWRGLYAAVAALRTLYGAAEVVGHGEIPGEQTLCPGVDSLTMPEEATMTAETAQALETAVEIHVDRKTGYHYPHSVSVLGGVLGETTDPELQEARDLYAQAAGLRLLARDTWPSSHETYANQVGRAARLEREAMDIVLQVIDPVLYPDGSEG